MRQQCEEEKLSIIASYEKQVLELQSTSSTPLQSTQAASTVDWRPELMKLKVALKNHQVPADVLFCLDNAIQTIEVTWLRNQNALQEQSEKYRQLKRRVRDYQKYVNEKLSKCKSDREQSEMYCRRVISELLSKVTQELQRIEKDRHNEAVANAAHPPAAPVSVGNRTPANIGFNQQHPSSEPEPTFAQSIDDLQEQVNRYVLGLTNFTNGMK